jgi:SpoIIAA-like
MLHILPESQTCILGVKATGKFTDQDYREFLIPRLAELIQEYGRVRVLLYLDEDLQGWETEALRNEPFGHEQKNTFQKIAVVGGSWWLRLEMKLITPFLAGEVRNFSRSELPEAWTWIRE